MKREDVTNGIFISFLKRRVCEDEKVTVMLDRVAEGTWKTGGMREVDVEMEQNGCIKIKRFFVIVCDQTKNNLLDVLQNENELTFIS